MLLINGDCIKEMQKLIDDGVQVDSVVTDPPYELGFMGKSWDSTGIAFNPKTWELALKLLKPGGIYLDFLLLVIITEWLLQSKMLDLKFVTR